MTSFLFRHWNHSVQWQWGGNKHSWVMHAHRMKDSPYGFRVSEAYSWDTSTFKIVASINGTKFVLMKSSLDRLLAQILIRIQMHWTEVSGLTDVGLFACLICLEYCGIKHHRPSKQHCAMCNFQTNAVTSHCHFKPQLNIRTAYAYALLPACN